MKSNFKAAQQYYGDRDKSSTKNRLRLVINIIKFFGGSVTNIINSEDFSKSIKKTLKQNLKEYSKKDVYFKEFIDDPPSLELLYGTPLYKHFQRNEPFSSFKMLFCNFKHNPTHNAAEVENHCYAAMTLLLYALTGLAMIIPSSQLLDALKEIRTTTEIALCDSSKNPFEDDKNTYFSWEAASEVASQIMSGCGDTWVHHYISALFTDSILTLDKINLDDMDALRDISVPFEDKYNQILGLVSFYLTLLLHDEQSLLYFGNLPFQLLASTELPDYFVSRLILDEFGKMFFVRSDKKINNTEDFINASEGHFVYENGKIVVGKEKPIATPDEWCFLTGTISEFEPVYNPETFLHYLGVNSPDFYLFYTATDLNTPICRANGRNEYSLNIILDNYHNNPVVGSCFANICHNETDKPYEFMEKPTSSPQFADMFCLGTRFKESDNVIYKTSALPEIDLNNIDESLAGINFENISKTTEIVAQLTHAFFYEGFYVGAVDHDNYLKTIDDSIDNLLGLLGLPKNEKTVAGCLNVACDTITAYRAYICNVYRNLVYDYTNTSPNVVVSKLAVQSLATCAYAEKQWLKKTCGAVEDLRKSLAIVRNSNDELTTKYKQSKLEISKLKNDIKATQRELELANIKLSKTSEFAKLQEEIKQLKAENMALKQEPAKLNNIIAKQQSRIENLENKQSNQKQTDDYIKQLEDTIAEYERLLKARDITPTEKVDFTPEERRILSKIKVDLTVFDCESNRILQREYLTNSKFNFVQQSRGDANKFNFSKNAQLYLFATNRVSHAINELWDKAVPNDRDYKIYVNSNGINTICRAILDKYYALVKAGKLPEL